jgi:hypothetical protein
MIACGDGLWPGVDRTEPEKPVCKDKDNADEVPKCMSNEPEP